MPLTQYSTSPQLVAPSAAAPLSITPSGTSWGNSAWVQVIASTSTAIVVTGIQPIVFGVAVAFEIDVGVGAAGAEVVVTTFRGYVADTNYYDKCQFPLVIPTDNIPVSSRVALRLRKSGISLVPWTMVLTYWAKPISGSVLITAKPQKCVPSAANNVTLTSGGVWTNSTWTTIIASAAANLVLTGIIFPTFSSGMACELDLGIGAAGLETVITTIRIDNTGFADAGFYYPLWNPLDIITAGSRVSARNRRDAGGGTATVALTYVEKPL